MDLLLPKLHKEPSQSSNIDLVETANVRSQPPALPVLQMTDNMAMDDEVVVLDSDEDDDDDDGPPVLDW